MNTRVILVVSVMLCLASISQAEQSPKTTLSSDQRVKTLIYKETDVFRVHGHYYYQSVITFSEDESVQAISSGRPSAWEIQPIGRYVMLRPIEEAAKTNVTILTNKRLYHFLLDAHYNQSDQADDLSVNIRFRYPKDEFIQLANEAEKQRVQAQQDEEQAQQRYTTNRTIDPSQLNLSYQVTGDQALVPVNVFDDGQFTYFQFAPDQPVPSIYQVDADRSERLVNFTQKGPYTVVKTTAHQFSLRQGRFLTCVFQGKTGSSQR